MSIKISPFNVHTVNMYGLKKLEEMDRQHKEQKLKKAPKETEEIEEAVSEEKVAPDIETAPEETAGETPLPEWEVDLPEVNEATEESDEDLESLSEDELRELAKSLDIDYWWTKGEERLIDEIKKAKGLA